MTTPQEVALLDSRKSVTFARKLGIPIYGIVENMSGLVCPHCSETVDLFKSGGGEKAAGEMGGVTFLGRVPIDLWSLFRVTAESLMCWKLKTHRQRTLSKPSQRIFSARL